MKEIFLNNDDKARLVLDIYVKFLNAATADSFPRERNIYLNNLAEVSIIAAEVLIEKIYKRNNWL